MPHVQIFSDKPICNSYDWRTSFGTHLDLDGDTQHLFPRDSWLHLAASFHGKSTTTIPHQTSNNRVFKKMHPRSIYLHWFRTSFSFLRLPQIWGISLFLTKPNFEKCSLPLGLPSLPPSAEARRWERHLGRNSACSDR